MAGESDALDLDRPGPWGIRREIWIFGAILAIATILRLLWLAPRPLHHDESIHAYYSWRILTVGISDYRYDPRITAQRSTTSPPIFQLLGQSDFSVRLFPSPAASAWSRSLGHSAP